VRERYDMEKGTHLSKPIGIGGGQRGRVNFQNRDFFSSKYSMILLPSKTKYCAGYTPLNLNYSKRDTAGKICKKANPIAFCLVLFLFPTFDDKKTSFVSLSK
jgi:hypothetical protein